MKRKVRAGLILMGVQLIIIFYLAFIRPTTNINTIIEMDYTSTSLLPPPLIDIDIFSLSTIQVITSITILNTLDINQRCSSQSLPKTFGRNEIRQIPIGSEKFLCDYGQLFFNPRENQNYSLLLDFNLFSQNYQSNFTCTVPIASRIPNNEPRKCKSEYIFTQYYDNDKIETIFQLKDYFQLPKIISQENFIEFLDISISFDVISMTKCPPFSHPCGRKCCADDQLNADNNINDNNNDNDNSNSNSNNNNKNNNRNTAGRVSTFLSDRNNN